MGMIDLGDGMTVEIDRMHRGDAYCVWFDGCADAESFFEHSYFITEEAARNAAEAYLQDKAERWLTAINKLKYARKRNAG